MINEIKYVISEDFYPYHNLALEEYLLHYVKPGQCILYLWQNEKTVVIGRNQNAWKECKVSELEEGGGRLVRRLSGGGAVFHDLGNLNFTFLVNKEDYDLDKQLSVILEAVRNLGMEAEKSGRNDITVDGRKFSGNAFYTEGNKCYHHGTILVHVDMENLSRYLNVSKEKLSSKGVSSVKSRVINLSEYKNDLTIDKMKSELIAAFGQVYNAIPVQMKEEEIDRDLIKTLSDKFSSNDYKYGKKFEMTYSFGKRFPWGGVDIALVAEAGRIKECMVYSDSMDIWLAEQLPNYLVGCPFHSKEMVKALLELKVEDEAHLSMLEDIIDMILIEEI